MILEKADQCSPRPKVTPTPRLGPVSPGGLHQEYNLVIDRDHHTIKHVIQYVFEELAKLIAFALLTSTRDPFYLLRGYEHPGERQMDECYGEEDGVFAEESKMGY